MIQEISSQLWPLAWLLIKFGVVSTILYIVIAVMIYPIFLIIQDIINMRSDKQSKSENLEIKKLKDQIKERQLEISNLKLSVKRYKLEIKTLRFNKNEKLLKKEEND